MPTANINTDQRHTPTIQSTPLPTSAACDFVCISWRAASCDATHTTATHTSNAQEFQDTLPPPVLHGQHALLLASTVPHVHAPGRFPPLHASQPPAHHRSLSRSRNKRPSWCDLTCLAAASRAVRSSSSCLAFSLAASAARLAAPSSTLGALTALPSDCCSPASTRRMTALASPLRTHKHYHSRPNTRPTNHSSAYR